MSAFSDAVRTALGAPTRRVYPIGGVPTTPSYPYTVVAVSFDAAGAYSLDADHGIGTYRVTTQSFARTADGAEDFDTEARTRLLDQRVTADGKTFGPGRLQVGGAVVRDPDQQGVIGITSTYLFDTEE